MPQLRVEQIDMIDRVDRQCGHVIVDSISTVVTGDVDVTKIGGAALTLGQKLSASSIPVVLASDQSQVSIAGSVNATQAGAWSVSVSNFPATQSVTQGTVPWVVSLASTTITGTVAVTQSGVWSIGRTWDLGFATDQVDASGSSVSVSNFPATQPISAASLPLPTGAATSALQTQPGVDIGDVTVNNAAGASAVNIQDGGNSITIDGSISVSNFPATQPVSGTVAVTQSTSPWVTNDPGLPDTLGQKTMAGSTGVVIASDQTAIPISGTITATPTGTQDVNITQVSGSSFTLGQQLAAASLPVVLTAAQLSTLTPLSTMAVTQSTSPWVVSLSSTTITGTVAVTQSGTWNISTLTTVTNPVGIKGADGSAIASNANPIPISDAGGSITVDGTVAATQSGTWTNTVTQATGTNLHTVVDSGTITTVSSVTAIANALPTGTNALGRTSPEATSSAVGSTPYLNTALSNTKQQVKGSAANIYGYHLFNPGALVTYIQMFNKTSASVTVGTTTPDNVIALPAGGGVDMMGSVPIGYGTGFTIAATTTSTGSTAPATAVLANYYYI